MDKQKVIERVTNLIGKDECNVTLGLLCVLNALYYDYNGVIIADGGIPMEEMGQVLTQLRERSWNQIKLSEELFDLIHDITNIRTVSTLDSLEVKEV